jgi:hypothetical protein
MWWGGGAFRSVKMDTHIWLSMFISMFTGNMFNIFFLSRNKTGTMHNNNREIENSTVYGHSVCEKDSDRETTQMAAQCTLH